MEGLSYNELGLRLDSRLLECLSLHQEMGELRTQLDPAMREVCVCASAWGRGRGRGCRAHLRQPVRPGRCLGGQGTTGGGDR
jgi:hypothetical protein